MWRLACVLAVGGTMNTDTTVLNICCLFCYVYLFRCERLLCFVENAPKKVLQK